MTYIDIVNNTAPLFHSHHPVFSLYQYQCYLNSVERDPALYALIEAFPPFGLSHWSQLLSNSQEKWATWLPKASQLPTVNIHNAAKNSSDIFQKIKNWLLTSFPQKTSHDYQSLFQIVLPYVSHDHPLDLTQYESQPELAQKLKSFQEEIDRLLIQNEHNRANTRKKEGATPAIRNQAAASLETIKKDFDRYFPWIEKQFQRGAQLSRALLNSLYVWHHSCENPFDLALPTLIEIFDQGRSGRHLEGGIEKGTEYSCLLGLEERIQVSMKPIYDYLVEKSAHPPQISEKIRALLSPWVTVHDGSYVPTQALFQAFLEAKRLIEQQISGYCWQLKSDSHEDSASWQACRNQYVSHPLKRQEALNKYRDLQKIHDRTTLEENITGKLLSEFQNRIGSIPTLSQQSHDFNFNSIDIEIGINTLFEQAPWTFDAFIARPLEVLAQEDCELSTPSAINQYQNEFCHFNSLFATTQPPIPSKEDEEELIEKMSNCTGCSTEQIRLILTIIGQSYQMSTDSLYGLQTLETYLEYRPSHLHEMLNWRVFEGLSTTIASFQQAQSAVLSLFEQKIIPSVGLLNLPPEQIFSIWQDFSGNSFKSCLPISQEQFLFSDIIGMIHAQTPSNLNEHVQNLLYFCAQNGLSKIYCHLIRTNSQPDLNQFAITLLIQYGHFLCLRLIDEHCRPYFPSDMLQHCVDGFSLSLQTPYVEITQEIITINNQLSSDWIHTITTEIENQAYLKFSEYPDSSMLELLYLTGFHREFLNPLPEILHTAILNNPENALYLLHHGMTWNESHTVSAIRNQRTHVWEFFTSSPHFNPHYEQDGLPLIAYACQVQNLKMIQDLLQHHVDTSWCTPQHYSLLSLIFDQESPSDEIIFLLIDHGVNLNALVHTPLPTMPHPTWIYRSALIDAIRNYRADLIELFFSKGCEWIARGTDIAQRPIQVHCAHALFSPRFKDASPLETLEAMRHHAWHPYRHTGEATHIYKTFAPTFLTNAAKYGAVQLVRTILDLNLDLSADCLNGYLALHTAIEHEKTDIIEILIPHLQQKYAQIYSENLFEILSKCPTPVIFETVLKCSHVTEEEAFQLRDEEQSHLLLERIKNNNGKLVEWSEIGIKNSQENFEINSSPINKMAWWICKKAPTLLIEHDIHSQGALYYALRNDRMSLFPYLIQQIQLYHPEYFSQIHQKEWDLMLAQQNLLAITLYLKAGFNIFSIHLHRSKIFLCDFVLPQWPSFCQDLRNFIKTHAEHKYLHPVLEIFETQFHSCLNKLCGRKNWDLLDRLSEKFPLILGIDESAIPSELAYYAIKYGAIEILEKLAQSSPQVFLLSRGKDAWNALHSACNYGQHRVIEYLMNLEVEGRPLFSIREINARTISGLTPLMIACSTPHENIITLLLDNDADKTILLNAPALHGFSAFSIAHRSGKSQAICERLLIHREDPNFALHLQLTAQMGQGSEMDIITRSWTSEELLNAHGLFLTTVKSSNLSVIQWWMAKLLSITHDQIIFLVNLFERLLEEKAQIPIWNQIFESLCSHNISFSEIQNHDTILKALGQYGTQEILNLFFIKGYNLQRRNDTGRTLLMYACQNNNTEPLKLLIPQGFAPFEEKDDDQRTILDYCIQAHSLDCLEIILQRAPTRYHFDIFSKVAKEIDAKIFSNILTRFLPPLLKVIQYSQEDCMLHVAFEICCTSNLLKIESLFSIKDYNMMPLITTMQHLPQIEKMIEAIKNIPNFEMLITSTNSPIKEIYFRLQASLFKQKTSQIQYDAIQTQAIKEWALSMMQYADPTCLEIFLSSYETYSNENYISPIRRNDKMHFLENQCTPLFIECLLVTNRLDWMHLLIDFIRDLYLNDLQFAFSNHSPHTRKTHANELKTVQDFIISHGSPTAIRYALEHGILSPDYCDHAGRSPFYLAMIFDQSLDALKELSQAYSLEKRVGDRTTLMLATQYSKKTAVEWISSQLSPATRHATTIDGENALYFYFLREDHFFRKCIKSNIESPRQHDIFNQLIQDSLTLHIRPRSGVTLLMCAAYLGSPELILQILQQDPTLIRQRDAYGCGALDYATMSPYLQSSKESQMFFVEKVYRPMIEAGENIYDTNLAKMSCYNILNFKYRTVQRTIVLICKNRHNTETQANILNPVHHLKKIIDSGYQITQSHPFFNKKHYPYQTLNRDDSLSFTRNYCKNFQHVLLLVLQHKQSASLFPQALLLHPDFKEFAFTGLEIMITTDKVKICALLFHKIESKNEALLQKMLSWSLPPLVHYAYSEYAFPVIKDSKILELVLSELKEHYFSIPEIKYTIVEKIRNILLSNRLMHCHQRKDFVLVYLKYLMIFDDQWQDLFMKIYHPSQIISPVQPQDRPHNYYRHHTIFQHGLLHESIEIYGEICKMMKKYETQDTSLNNLMFSQTLRAIEIDYDMIFQELCRSQIKTHFFPYLTMSQKEIFWYDILLNGQRVISIPQKSLETSYTDIFEFLLEIDPTIIDRPRADGSSILMVLIQMISTPGYPATHITTLMSLIDILIAAGASIQYVNPNTTFSVLDYAQTFENLPNGLMEKLEHGLIQENQRLQEAIQTPMDVEKKTLHPKGLHTTSQKKRAIASRKVTGTAKRNAPENEQTLLMKRKPDHQLPSTPCNVSSSQPILFRTSSQLNRQSTDAEATPPKKARIDE